MKRLRQVTRFKCLAVLAAAVLTVPLAPSCEAAPAPLTHETSPDATAGDVQLYVPFNGSLDARKPTDGVRAIHFKSSQDNRPEFVDGLEGRALHITKANQNQLSLIHEIPAWPLAKGSLVLSFRPEKELKDNSTFWLAMGEWAKFDVHVEGSRLLFYCTENPEQFLVADLKDFAADWVGKWHSVVAVWDGGGRSLYFDGRLVASKSGVKPRAPGPPGALAVGYLPQAANTPSFGFLEGDIDELAILKAPLTARQAEQLAARGKEGLLQILGGDILGTLPRKAFVRGEKTTLKVFPYATGDSIRIAAVPEGEKIAYPLASLPCRPGEVNIDTGQLRPGRYRLRLELRKAGKTLLSDESLTIGINAARASEFPVGIDSLNLYPGKTLEIMRKWHIGLSSNGGFYTTEGAFKDLDRLYSYGISSQPNLNIHYHRAWLPYLKNPDQHFADGAGGKENVRDFEELLQGINYEDDTRFSSSLGSPFSKVGREAMKSRITDVLAAFRGHPGLHSLSFDDEYDLRNGTDPKTRKRWYGDYGPQARQYFKAKTGLDKAIYPPREPAGTVFPDDLPYFKWRDVIGMPGDPTTAGLHMNNAEQVALVHKLRPDVQTTTWSGGEYGEVDAVMDYTYPTIWQPYVGFEAGQARLDFTFDRHRGRQRGERLKPVWGLTGWWSSNLQGQPAWCVEDFRLSTVMTLAKGAKLMLWFTAYPPSDTPAGQLGAGLLSREDLAGETHRWADWVHRYGGLFARLQAKPSRRVAVLLSEANRVGMIHKSDSPIFLDRFYPAMRAAGVPVDIVTDEQVAAGKLKEYEALCLFNIQYTSASVWEKINEFSRTKGKVVVCDLGTAPTLRPTGTVVLDVNVLADQPVKPGQTAMQNIVETIKANTVYCRAKIAPLLRPDNLAVHGSNLVAPHWLSGNEGSFLGIVNYNLFGTETVDVSLKNVGGAVYDLSRGKMVTQAPKGRPLSWKAAGIEKAGWKPYLLLPRKIGAVRVSLKMNAGTFAISAAVMGASGAAIKAPIPLHIQFFAPGGTEVTAYERYTATDAATGLASLQIRRAALMDTSGNWTVKVTELAGGQQASAKVQI